VSFADDFESELGSFDGASCAIGAVAGLVLAHASVPVILVTGSGLAASAAVGMGLWECLGDEELHEPFHRAAVMAGATFASVILASLSVSLIPGEWGISIAILFLVTLTLLIAEWGRRNGRTKAYLNSFGLMVGAAVGAVLVFVGLGTV
jgi:hypothetical protein